jgi:hypothetical protein
VLLTLKTFLQKGRYIILDLLNVRGKMTSTSRQLKASLKEGPKALPSREAILTTINHIL